MLVKEEDAKQKLCPERCYASLRVLCEGTQCMAWRTVKVDTPDHKNFGGEKATVYGYCGLAGRVHHKRWRLMP